MPPDRPNPDELLVRVQHEEKRGKRGKLRIFFGYAAGSGKTYAMLQAAQRERAAGVDVVVGYVEPHGRPETTGLLAGLEAIPVQEIPHHAVKLREFNLDAALARKPKLILVDELAHTNAEGVRHAKRWQDVQELLAAGIDVWTTLNVQHIESINDVIAQITGVVVRETLPDAVLEQADELELIDITPDELLERFKAGKVYVLRQIDLALEGFFRKGNLVALRELLLRQAAQRLQRDVESARRERSALAPWLTAERLLVCVGPSPNSARTIRSAKRLAASLEAEWLAVAVDTGATGPAASRNHEQTMRNLRLAARLGAEVHTIVGQNVAEAVLDFACTRNVSKIVVGKSDDPPWKRWWKGNIVDQLVKQSGDIDVYMVSGDGELDRSPHLPVDYKPGKPADYFQAAVVVAVCTALGFGAQALRLSETNVVMIFLAGVALVAAALGRGPATAASIASVLVFDFCFVPPHFTFAVSDAEYVITFGVMLGIGVLISELTARLHAQLCASQLQVEHTDRLYRMTRQLSQLAGSEFLVVTAGRQLEEIFDAEGVVYLRGPDDRLAVRYGQKSAIAEQPLSAEVARWVTSNSQLAGAGTNTLPNAAGLFVPLIGSQRTVGAIGVKPRQAGGSFDSEDQRLLEACASLIALSIERDESLLEAQEAQVRVEAEQLRNSLLNSVSHDLRTPLATIAGTASMLKDGAAPRDPEIMQTLVDESNRLSRLVDNLLDMARLDAGEITLKRDWHVLEEVIGVALASLKRQLAGHSVGVEIPADFPLLWIDGVLMEQVFVNLLDNASRHTPAGSTIEMIARMQGGNAIVDIADNGPGLPPGVESMVFDKFFRGASISPDGRRGVGLGLAICRATVQAHGGRIEAMNRPEGGAVFRVTLQCDKAPPMIDDQRQAAAVG
jgi:two-component system sensor histidine kinase KdpD